MSDEPRKLGCLGVAAIFLAGSFVGVVVGGAIGFALGGIQGERGRYNARYLEERAAVSPAIEKDPAFKAVKIEEKSDGGIWLSGEVPTTADKKRLEQIVARANGENRAHAAVLAVDVLEKP